MEKLQQMASDFWTWLQVQVLIPDALVQIVLVIGFAVIAHFAAKLINRKITAISQRGKLLSKIEDFIDPLYFPAVLLIFIVIAQVAGILLGYPVEVLIIAGNLATAWIVIRLLTRFITNQQLARTVALLIWVIAALNIFNLLEPLIQILESAAIQIGDTTVSAYNIIWGLLTLIFFIWVAVALSKIIEAQLKTIRGVTPSVRVLLVKVSKIFLITIAFLVGLNTMGIDLTALAVFGGALGVGLGFGLQKVVSNFISGVVLVMDKSIKPGDVIEIQDTFGTINKMAARYTSVITRDGTEYLIPNEDMVTQPVINWSHTNRVVRRKIPVTVAYKTDLYRAREIMNEAAAAHERALEDPKPITHVLGFGDSGVELQLRFWINDPENGVTNVSSEVMLFIWDKFQEEGIEFPYPQRVIHFAGDTPSKKRKFRKKKSK